MRFRGLLLLALAVLPAIPAFAAETADETQAILAIGRLGARIELDDKLPGARWSASTSADATDLKTRIVTC